MNQDLHPIEVSIQNYQSIDNLNFEIYGFTCITGKSNIGKSAIVRAISSALVNNPVVGAVRKGASFCSVLVRSNDWELIWEKSEKGSGKYLVNGKSYDKVGQGQIEPVQSLGFKSVKVGSKNTYPWLASQFSPIFLLDESGPAITDFISEVSRLNVLQNSISISLKGKKSALDEARIKTLDVQIAKDKISSLNKLDDLINLGLDLEAQANSIREYESKILSGQSFIEKISSHSNKVNSLSSIDGVNVPDDKITPLFDYYFKVHSLWKLIDSAANKVISIRNGSKLIIPDLLEKEYDTFKSVQRFEGYTDLKQSVSDLDKSMVIPDLNLNQEFDEFKSMSNLNDKIRVVAESIIFLNKKLDVPESDADFDNFSKMSVLNGKIKDITDEMDDLCSSFNTFDFELKNLEEEISKIPSCPSCGRPVSDSHSTHAS
jgi:hypothetical protein